MELDIFEVLQSLCACHFGVEALAAELPVAVLHRAVAHNVVGGCRCAAALAPARTVSVLGIVPHENSRNRVSNGRIGTAYLDPMQQPCPAHGECSGGMNFGSPTAPWDTCH